MMTTSLPESISNYLLEHFSLPKIKQITPVFGGDINRAFKIDTSEAVIFLKLNEANKLPMFIAEAKGLALLKANSKFKIPNFILHDKVEEHSILVLEFIDTDPSPTTHFGFGRLLAKMHSIEQAYFGLDIDNYIGSLTQHNTACKSWKDFFGSMRIEHQFKMAFDKGFFNSSDSRLVDSLISKLDEIVPIEHSSLVHGDLWAGNYVQSKQKKHVLIDPAVYFGHREMDIAMMHLFGGFPAQVFEEYNEEWPMEKGWQKRLKLHNIYPLLVHVNLFGGSYVSQARQAIASFA